MKDELKSSLDAMFQADGERKSAAQKAQDEGLRKEAEFLAAFHACAETLIKPAMEEIGAYAEEKGYPYRIDEHREETGQGARRQPASIAIVFVMQKGKYHPTNELPSFAVRCDKSGRKVEFLENTMSPGNPGRSGGAGEASLEELTRDMVQAKIVSLLQEVFARTA